MLRAFTPPGGGGGGGISGSGTPGKLAKFTGATALGDSLLSESGTTITSAATAETFGSPQTWTLPGNASGLTIKSSSGNSTFVLSTYSGGVGINVGSGGPGTLLDVSDGSGYAFAGSTYEGVRLLRVTEALFSSSDGTRSFRAGVTGSTAVVGTSTAHDLLLQRNNVTAATLQSGAIATVTLTAGGTLYTNGTYAQQALTGGTGTGATADIVVAGGIVTSCVLRSPGTGYAAADALSCATIGAGAGFVLTVATIAQIVAGSGNVTALGRIGAGTATPRAALDAVGGAYVEGFTNAPTWNAQGGASVLTPTMLLLSNASSANNTYQPPAGAGGSRGINVALRVDTSLQTASSYNYGQWVVSSLAEASASTAYIYGGTFTSWVNTTGLSGKTAVLLGLTGQVVVQATAGSNTFTDMVAVGGNLTLTAPAVQTVSTLAHFRTSTASISGAAHVVTNFAGFMHMPAGLNNGATVTNFYGIQLQAPTTAGGATITNRWGISQEDTLAKNYFAGNVGIGTPAPSGPLSVTPLQYSTGTASQALLVVTGVGTTFTAAMVGSQLVFANGVSAGTITAFINATTINVSISQTVTSQAYKISYTGLQVSTVGNVVIGGNLAFNSGFGSTSTAYGCRAWINFIGATAVIRGSGGVSSLTRASAGNYTINYTTAMPDINYSAVATKQSNAVNTDCQLYDYIALRATTSSTWVNVENSGIVDSANINIAFFR